MPTYRCPVLVWRNGGGPFTASLIEQHDRAAVALTPREALDQLRSLLDWRYREDPWRDPPDLKDPELIVFKVSVRPEYRDEVSGRRFPVQQPIDLRVCCVIGKQSGGLRLASIPMIGLRMNLSEHDDAKILIPQMIQRWFEGQTPRQLSRHVLPDNVFLEDLYIPIDSRRSTGRTRLKTDLLERIADPPGDAKVRALFGRAWERDREVDDFVRRLKSERGELRMIAEVSPAELDACRRLLPGFTDLFQVFTMDGLDQARAIQILDRVAEGIAAQSRLTVGSDASSRTVHLFRRFQPYHALPGEVVAFWRDLLDRTARTTEKAVTSDTVVKAFLRRTGLPELFLRDDRPLSREQVIAGFEAEIVGQRKACETAADVVISFKAGMNDPHRPLGVLLFCGPTGVGKTELAKAVSRGLFSGQLASNSQQSALAARMIRLDMSEYSGPWAADRLLMQSDGEPSDFLQQIRRQPFTVLLLDEIEKAHPSVYDVLMNVFDEGRLTDRFGRVTWFRSTVILLTSNLGADSSGQVGFSETAASADTRHESAVRGFFRPEFFNRLDGVITFDPLSHASIIDITEKELRNIAGREGLTKMRIQLSWTPDVVEHLARAGFDPRYGARPLQRTLETLIVSPLSRWLMNRQHKERRNLRLSISETGAIQISDAA